MKRKLGKIGTETSAMGMGCWAIGGDWNFLDVPAGWGPTDDKESLKALDAAYDNGIRLFDTAANYGVGLSEKLVGQALKGKRQECVISTKFGYKLDDEKKIVSGYGSEPMEKSDVKNHLKADCEASLKRLDTDYIDVFFLHHNSYDNTMALELLPLLEELVKEGKIRSYGWSTDDLPSAKLWMKGEHYSSIQINFNIAADAPGMLKLCDEQNLIAFNRGPLAMGFLTGKYNMDSKFSASDIRNVEWVQEGFRKPVLEKLDLLKEVLTSDGRTPAQGALSWIWAKSEKTLPIPGIRTVKQAEENAGAMKFGPLNQTQLTQIEEIMGR